MSKAKPPFKLALAAVLLDGRPRDLGELMKALAPEYQGQAFFEQKHVLYCLQGLKAVGIVSSAAGSEPLYSLTGYGAERVRKNLDC